MIRDEVHAIRKVRRVVAFLQTFRIERVEPQRPGPEHGEIRRRGAAFDRRDGRISLGRRIGLEAGKVDAFPAGIEQPKMERLVDVRGAVFFHANAHVTRGFMGFDGSARRGRSKRGACERRQCGAAETSHILHLPTQPDRAKFRAIGLSERARCCVLAVRLLIRAASAPSLRPSNLSRCRAGPST